MKLRLASSIIMFSIFLPSSTNSQTPAPPPTPSSADVIIANFTIVLAIATIVLAIATVILMVFTGMLWFETKRIAKISREQTDNTKQSLEVSNRTAATAENALAFTREQAVLIGRPWLKLVLTDFRIEQDPESNGSLVSYFTEITNLGTRPALNVEIVYAKNSHSSAASHQEAIDQLSSRDRSIIPNGYTILPGETIRKGRNGVVSPTAAEPGQVISVMIAQIVQFQDVLTEKYHYATEHRSLVVEVIRAPDRINITENSPLGHMRPT